MSNSQHSAIAGRSRAARPLMFFSAVLFFLGALVHVTFSADRLRLDFWNPQFHCEQTIFDFGEASPKGTLKHDFRVENAGSGCLTVVGLSPGCGCMGILSSNLELKAKETGVFSAVLALGGLHGPQTKVVEVMTNDPMHRHMRFVFRGDVLTSYDVSSYTVSLDSRRPKGRAKEVTVRAKESVMPFAILDAKASPALVDVSVDDRKAQQHVVTMRLKDGVRGPGHCTIHLITDNEDEPDILIDLSVDGAVSGSRQEGAAT